MGKNQNQSNFTVWSAIIGVMGVIIGGVLGYLGTQASAQAQIETAKINIYGPIYATQTAEAKIASPVLMTPGADSLSIEQIEQRVFAYDGSAEDLGGWANYDTFFDGVDGKPHYELNYDIPGDETGYAGLAFQFERGVNVSMYKAIALTLEFEGVNNPIDLYVKDISGNGKSVRIVSNSTDGMPLRYEFSNFGDVDFNALKEIGINVDNSFTSGSHSVTIYSIYFEQ